MLNKIIYYSLHNRLVVLICALLLMIAGTYTAFHTDVDVFSDRGYHDGSKWYGS